MQVLIQPLYFLFVIINYYPKISLSYLQNHFYLDHYDFVKEVKIHQMLIYFISLEVDQLTFLSSK